MGQSIADLFPDRQRAEVALGSPDHLPYETSFEAGPYRVRLQAGAVFSNEDEFIGSVVLWEVLGMVSSKADASLPDLNASMLDELVEEADLMDANFGGRPEFDEAPTDPSREQQDALAQGLVDADRQLTRSTTLVGRSVRLLSERLATIMSMVEALCNEGDNLHQSQEEMRQRTRNVAFLVTERSETLWELTQEMKGLEERTRASATLIKRLKKSHEDAEQVSFSIGHVSDAIDHLVVQARLEIARAGDAGGGMKIIVDEIRKLGREALRTQKEVKKRMDIFGIEAVDALALIEEDRREVRSGVRIARRAEMALERIEKELGEVEERTHLLTDMTSGQSEISSHIADQLGELTDLIHVTQRVANEQTRMISNILSHADAQVTESKTRV